MYDRRNYSEDQLSIAKMRGRLASELEESIFDNPFSLDQLPLRKEWITGYREREREMESMSDTRSEMDTIKALLNTGMALDEQSQLILAAMHKIKKGHTIKDAAEATLKEVI